MIETETAMQPTVFHYKRSKTVAQNLALLAIALILGQFAVRQTAYEYSEILSARIWDAHWLELAILALYSFAVVVLLAKAVGVDILYRRWAPIYLSLDDEGLTHAPGLLSPARRWAWSELSAFEHQDAHFLSRWLTGPEISFLPAKPGLAKPGLMYRLEMLLTRAKPKSTISDLFDASPREIAAKLNEYRDRAVAKPGAGGTQSTPAGRDRP